MTRATVVLQASLAYLDGPIIMGASARNRCLQARGGIARRPHRSPVYQRCQGDLW